MEKTETDSTNTFKEERNLSLVRNQINANITIIQYEFCLVNLQKLMLISKAGTLIYC